MYFEIPGLWVKRSWIYCCVYMVRISILVKWSSLGFFSSLWRTKTEIFFIGKMGGLLSPFLFVLAFWSLEGWLQELQSEVYGQAFKWVAWVVWK